eukprot:scaffold51004_cov61-Phaeocystis_antarctica.AAC.6
MSSSISPSSPPSLGRATAKGAVSEGKDKIASSRLLPAPATGAAATAAGAPATAVTASTATAATGAPDAPASPPRVAARVRLRPDMRGSPSSPSRCGELCLELPLDECADECADEGADECVDEGADVCAVGRKLRQPTASGIAAPLDGPDVPSNAKALLAASAAAACSPSGSCASAPEDGGVGGRSISWTARRVWLTASLGIARRGGW